jgi:3-oxoacyl-[acyl-carrier-protein] synthase-3
MSQIKTFITSTGSYLPEKVLTNKLLEAMVDTSDEWIVSRTGIKERRIAGDSETTSDLGVKAALKALGKANKTVDDIDLIIVATLSPDHVFPSTACLIQKKLNATCPAFDVGAACSGMVFALAAAKGFISSGLYQNVLVIASEKVSSVIDYKDRSTCVLFGDGASSALLSSSSTSKMSFEIGEIDLGCDGKMHASLEVPSGHPFMKMDGSTVFRHAVKRMSASIKTCLERASLLEDQIDYFIPHQANQRISDALLKRFSFGEEKVHKNVDRYGNTCAASIGIGLDEYMESKEGAGEHILLAAFGAGFTWGSMILKRGKVG